MASGLLGRYGITTTVDYLRHNRLGRSCHWLTLICRGTGDVTILLVRRGCGGIEIASFLCATHADAVCWNVAGWKGFTEILMDLFPDPWHVGIDTQRTACSCWLPYAYTADTSVGRLLGGIIHLVVYLIHLPNLT